MEVLHNTVESHLVKLFEDANPLAHQVKRITVKNPNLSYFVVLDMNLISKIADKGNLSGIDFNRIFVSDLLKSNKYIELCAYIIGNRSKRQ